MLELVAVYPVPVYPTPVQSPSPAAFYPLPPVQGARKAGDYPPTGRLITPPVLVRLIPLSPQARRVGVRWPSPVNLIPAPPPGLLIHVGK